MISLALAPISLLTPLQLSPEFSIQAEVIAPGAEPAALSACVSIPDWITLSDFVLNAGDCDAEVSAAITACVSVGDSLDPPMTDYDAARYIELETKHRALEVDHARVDSALRVWRYIAVGASVALVGVTVYMALDR